MIRRFHLYIYYSPNRGWCVWIVGTAHISRKLTQATVWAIFISDIKVRHMGIMRSYLLVILGSGI